MENTAKPKRKKGWVLTMIVIIVAVLVLIMIDSHFRLTVTQYTLSYDNLPAEFDGYRIVQLSDLHSRQFGEDNERLLEKVKEQEPDLIVLTGDLINRQNTGENKGQSEKLRTFFENLAVVAPCYFVSGNHEWASGEVADIENILTDSGIKYLKNEYVTLEKDGAQIVLSGVEDPNGMADMITPPELISDLRQSYPDSFVVFLGHRDDWLLKYPNLDVDVILCGHSHGGIVRLPFVGGVFGTASNLFPKYDAGVFNEGNYDMILSSGLGNITPIPRFLNPPEIVALTLAKN